MSQSHAEATRRVVEFSEGLRRYESSVMRRVRHPDSTDGAPDRADLLREIEVQHEELLVADEELRTQVEELERTAANAIAIADRYRLLFDLVPAPCLVTDASGVLEEVNAAASELLGADVAHLRGKPLHLFVDDTGRELTELLEGMSDSLRITRELRLRARAGAAAIVVDVTCTRSTLDARLTWMVRTASASRVAELERALRDRDDLLERERRARTQLERSHRAKDRFLAVLSHDLRAPINAVLGWAALLRKQTFDKAARDRALATIERSARSQLALVEQLLDVSRIAADKLQLDLVPLDLGAIVRATCDALLPAIADKGLTLTLDLDPQPITVFADRKRIEQVLTNLLSNAMKFTARGGHIDVTLRRSGAQADLVVKDDGSGIPQDVLPHVFDCFRQNTSDITSGSGLGLGLYIVRQLAQLHGGTASAESEGAGRGATLTVSIPVREIAVAPLTSQRLLSENAELEGMRVLVVEDDQDTRDLLSALLLDNGASVASAPDVPTALAMLEACEPDVIVSDIGLPGEDGLSLIRRLREGAFDIPAIAVSGFAHAADAERAVDAGFDAHVAKPLEAAKLIEQIQRVARHDDDER